MEDEVIHAMLELINSLDVAALEQLEIRIAIRKQELENEE